MQQFSRDQHSFTDMGCGRIQIPTYAYNAVVGTWLLAIDVSQIGPGFVWNSTNTQNDEMNFQVYLVQGSYTLDFLTIKDTNRAICTIELDDVDQFTWDGNGVQTYNQLVTGTIVATSSGLKKLTFAAKTSTSGNYYIVLTDISITRIT